MSSRRAFVSFLLLVASAIVVAGGSIEQTSQGSRPALALLASFDGIGVGLEAGPGTNHPPAPRKV